MDAHVSTPIGITAALFELTQRNAPAASPAQTTFTASHDAPGDPVMPPKKVHETARGELPPQFICNVRADWLPIDGREVIGEPQATKYTSAEQLKHDGIVGLYRKTVAAPAHLPGFLDSKFNPSSAEVES